MIYKNSIKILFSNFNIVWKSLLYYLFTFLISVTLIILCLNPIYQILNNEGLINRIVELYTDFITTLDLKEEASPGEIEDYLNCINEYNRKIEIEKLQLKMKNSIDVTEKLQLAQRIAVLNGRGE